MSATRTRVGAEADAVTLRSMSSTPSRANAKSLLRRYANVARDHPLNTVVQQACNYTSISFDVDGDDTSYDEYPYVYPEV